MRISDWSSDVCSSDLVGFGLWIVASVLVPGTAISPILLTGAFASSWLIGFVTPGAPAGFGVREVVLSLWLRVHAREYCRGSCLGTSHRHHAWRRVQPGLG